MTWVCDPAGPEGAIRPTWIEVDLEAIVHNYDVARRAVGPGVAAWPVIKGDGYGLGAVPIARALARAGAPGFCVALVEEGAALRDAGIDAPLVLLSGLNGACAREIDRLDLQPFLFEAHQGVEILSQLPENRRLPVHIKVDTGMGRLGVAPEAVATLLERLDALGDRVRLAGIVSHLACADEPARPETAEQTARFQSVLDQPALAGRSGLKTSLANSAGLLAHPATRFDWVRPGIMLYGGSPFFPGGSWSEAGLRPVATWRTRIIQISPLAAGRSLGYGHTFTARRDSRIAQLPVGYADGYNRRLGNRGAVLIQGRRAPVVGRVCMDLIHVDLTDLPQAAVGDPVVLMGEQGDELISTEEMAGWLETIPYEVTCALSRRVPRLHRPRVAAASGP